ncbi:MAG: ATP-binding cassette domain-containing protein [Thermoguttaceae bacterium]|nr:ATP-binding cassette domain-containing protein [Thermoguttaceae bacterium]
MSLIARNLSKTYKEGVNNQTVFTGVSLELDRGENLLVVGTTGSGKSTLINILGCLETPSSGTYLIGETDPLTFGRSKISKFRRDYLGFIFSEAYLLPQLTILENALIPCLATGLPLKADVAFAKQLLEQMKIGNCQDAHPESLSPEQRQRAAAVRAMIKRPSLILADEPTGRLDSRSAEPFIDDFLAAQKSCGSMLVMVTDSPDFKEKFDRTAKLDKTRWTISGRRKYGVDENDTVLNIRNSSEPAPALGLDEDEYIQDVESPQPKSESKPDEGEKLDAFRRRFQ